MTWTNKTNKRTTIVSTMRTIMKKKPKQTWMLKKNSRIGNENIHSQDHKNKYSKQNTKKKKTEETIETGWTGREWKLNTKY